MISNLAVDAGYVVLVLLGAVLFASVGRHPLAGICAAFAGVSGGFSANLVISSLDPLLAGFTDAAAKLYDPAYEVKRRLPYLDYSPNARFPIIGALFQGRAGTARHDAVAWGYARGADSHGVDIIQQCEVVGFLRENDRIVGVETTRGPISAGKVGLAVAGHTGHLAAKAGLRLPIETHMLQAFVSEPLKPMIDSLAWYALALLVTGGVLYSTGVIFYVNKKLKFARAIWHGHVVAAAAAHWTAVLLGVVLAAQH